MRDSASFWTDIKNLEEQLAKNPDSLCFARLSEVYLKTGLIDDALHTARLGVTKHPRYLSGQRAHALACHAKGLNDEALAALKLVTEAMPEDIPSQKLFGRLSAEAGARDAAIMAYLTALEFAPDDVESRIELEALERLAESIESDDVDEAIIEDLEILEETDDLDEEQPASEFLTQDTPTLSGSMLATNHDPLSTGTLAELYVKQGFIHKALEIYRAILADNPADRVTGERIVELEALDAGSPGFDAEVNNDISEEETEDLAVFSTTAETVGMSDESVAFPESGGFPPPESPQSSEDVSFCGSAPSQALSHGIADNALATLDGWLENIRRIRTCR